MIKNDPIRSLLRLMVIIFSIVAAIELGDVILEFFSMHAEHKSLGWPIFLQIAGIVLLICASTFGYKFSAKIWGRQDKRRELAMRGDAQLLAPEQPVANELALTIPTTIRLRWKMQWYLYVLAIPFVLTAIVIIVLVIASHHLSATQTIIVIAVTAGLLAFMLLIAFISIKIVIPRMSYYIEMTDRELVTHFSGFTTQIRWNEAQLFARSGINKAKRPKMYELSNAHSVARWFWLPQNTFFFYPLRPETSYEEYDRQMQALLQLIEAKTRLPLYDLSEKTNKWYL
jgi:hypothetical protein